MSAKSRKDAKDTNEEGLWDTPGHWPRSVRMISLDRLGAFGEDPRTGQVYWDGEPLRMKRQISLEGPTFWVAFLAAAATVAAAVWPIGLHYGWWPPVS